MPCGRELRVVPGVDDFPADLFAVPPLTRVWVAAAEAVPLFDL